MKTMNLLKSAAVIVAMAMSMAACNNEDVINDEQKSDKLVEVSLNCAGEIKDMGDVPMSRAGESNDLYYVQAFFVDKVGGGYVCYAHGLFDNVNDMRINLNEDDKYVFRATMIVDGKSFVYSELRSDSTYYYGAPFKTVLNNEFEYTGSFDVSSLTYGTTEEADYEGNILTYKRPYQYRFYGESEEYSPIKGGSVNINMIRTSFGVGIEVENLKAGESLYVSVEGTPGFTVNYPDTIVAYPFAFYEVGYSYYIDNLGNGEFANNYTEDMLVDIRRIDAEGKEFGVGSKVVSFRRNFIKYMKVTIANSPDGNGIILNVNKNEGWYQELDNEGFVGGIVE